MQMSGMDQIFWIAGFVGEILLACMLLFRRQYRVFPVFVAWVFLLVIEDPALYWVSQHAPILTYYRVYTVAQILDDVLQFGVLFEIAHSVLRPQQGRLSNRLLSVLGGLFIVSCLSALLWAVLQSHGSDQLNRAFFRVQRINFAFAWMRLALFAIIAGFSQMLGITWKNHVIRMAAGLAFYSAVSLVIQLTLSHLPEGNENMYTRDYWLLNHTQVIAYLCALTFWVWSFVQKDAPRREFTPQMQKILVTLSQAARRDRVSLTRSMGHK